MTCRATPATPTENCVVIHQEVDLQGIDLCETNLRGASLDVANLKEAKLRGVTMLDGSMHALRRRRYLRLTQGQGQ
jgi:uncharacterized protein YjbI with pentapeptide repeats